MLQLFSEHLRSSYRQRPPVRQHLLRPLWSGSKSLAFVAAAVVKNLDWQQPVVAAVAAAAVLNFAATAEHSQSLVVVAAAAVGFASAESLGWSPAVTGTGRIAGHSHSSCRSHLRLVHRLQAWIGYKILT